jgi:hypothetical protein
MILDNGVKLTDEAIDMLRTMQEDNNSTIESLIEGVENIEEMVANPESDPNSDERILMIQQLHGIRKLLRRLKVIPGYAYE